MKTRLALPFLAASLAVLTACPHRVRFGPEGEITEPQQLLRLLDERADKVQGIKAEAKARIQTPAQSGSVGEFIAAQRPDKLHLETLDFFGKPVAVLAADGERFALYNAEEAAYYTGPATAANVSRLLPLVLDPREAAAILLGEIPRIPAEQARLEIDPDARAYLLTLQSGPVTQRIWVGTEDYRPLRSELRGRRAYDLRFGDYQLVEETIFPMEVQISSVDARGEPAGVEVGLKYKDLEINPPVDPGLFILAQPPNTRRVEVGPLGTPLDSGEPPAEPAQPGLPPGAVPNG